VLLGLVAFILSVVLTIALELGWNFLRADARLAHDELIRVRAENATLTATQSEVAALRDQLDAERSLHNERLSKSETARRITEAHLGVLWGVYREQHDGIRVPLQAVLARMDVNADVAAPEWKMLHGKQAS
jgi:hypothetical protein